jgi:chromosome segregation ATPase
MANGAGEDFMRPVPIALAAIAIVGWLLVAYFSSRASDAQTQMHDAVNAAESARTAMAADLQNLQKASGSLADVQKQANDAKTALSEAVASRSSAQNELADLTKQIADARLAVSGAQEEASVKAKELQAVSDKAKAAEGQLTTLQGELNGLMAERDKAASALASARTDLANVQQQASSALAAAKSQAADLQQQGDAAAKSLADLQAKITQGQKDLEALQRQTADAEAAKKAAEQGKTQ